jgi:two-component system LytT family sensor kinase
MVDLSVVSVPLSGTNHLAREGKQAHACCSLRGEAGSLGHSIRNRNFWKLILLTFLLWTLFGLATALQYYATTMPSDRASFPLQRWLILTLSDNWLKATLTVPLVLSLMYLHAHVKRWFLRIAFYVLLFFGFAGLHVSLRPMVVPLVMFSDNERLSAPKMSYREKVALAARSFVLNDIMGFSVVVLIFNAWAYAQEMQQRTLNEERLTARLAQAELQALKMQLHPHFLFNTLNTIYNLAPDNSRKAQLMISRLSNLLRLSLDHVSSNLVTLQQEMEFLDCYLDIEKTRFEERLKVIEEIDPDALDGAVPNLLLQPLVENAIRHGIARKAAGGTVAIRAAKLGARLTITVTDDGRPATPDKQSKGIGLANTRARLTQLYGSDFMFDVQPAGEGTRVLIDIPFVPIESMASREEAVR